MLIADWLTVLISKVITINKTEDKRDTNKGRFLMKEKVKMSYLISLFGLFLTPVGTREFQIIPFYSD